MHLFEPIFEIWEISSKFFFLLITSRVFRFVQACFESAFSCITVCGLERIFGEIQDFFFREHPALSPLTYLSTYSVRTRTRTQSR